jgi:hypothetical protein
MWDVCRSLFAIADERRRGIRSRKPPILSIDRVRRFAVGSLDELVMMPLSNGNVLRIFGISVAVPMHY